VNRKDLGELFRRDAVRARSVSDFLDRYYKPDRYRGRGADYAASVLAYHQEAVEHDGWTMISHHESVTGKVVAYFPAKDAEPDQQLLLFGLESN
jgi:hypothetical protein